MAPNERVSAQEHEDVASSSAASRQELVGQMMAAAEEASQEATAMPQGAIDLDEEATLRNLTANVRDQDDLERDITIQANAALMEAEDKKDTARIEKLEANKSRLGDQLEKERLRLQRAGGNAYLSRNLMKEIARLEVEIEQIDSDIADFKARMEKRHQDNSLGDHSRGKSKRLPGESHREYLIRTGKITPFANVGGPRPEGTEGELADAILGAEEEAIEDELEDADEGPRSHQILRRPGFDDYPDPATSAIETEFSLRPRKRRRVKQEESSDDYDSSTATTPAAMSALSDDEELDADARRKGKSKAEPEEFKIDLSRIDDGNETMYQKRLADWVFRRSRARQRRAESDGGEAQEEEDVSEEWFKPAPDHADLPFTDGLKLPGDIHPSLFAYQKTGVQWLAELYSQNVGGIIGDEMGLGKTVQVIAFVAALHYSGRLHKPVIVVAPATVLRQWVNEFHRWWPPLRVSILHASGSGMLNLRNEDDSDVESRRRSKQTKSSGAARRIVNRVVKHGHVLVTTYTGLQSYAEELLDVEWEYAVLDEGHKIRNPNAEITITCKELNTPNRVILSGTPVQNNLSELWSLFDFIYPMRLGTLVNFRQQFEVPIRQGGYANASNLQIMTAEKCAETLKETISQYLLQRLKIDVAADLPEKTEQVLFCKLTPAQLKAYELFLKSDEVTAIMNRKRQSLYGIDILRKICNHPDLLDPLLRSKPGYEWGSPKKSGKLQVVNALLQMWKKFGHKTLLFSQGKQMLNIIESFIQKLDGVSYVRMDGETPVDQRQSLIDRFNGDPNLDVFLLTTRTGGLGVNLTGADRIIIFDPDWNPSTDMQARERAWRLGQTKPVSIYRLMTSGTIEEKIYHRQIFKQFMTNKVLKDPKQRTAFDIADLYDLFTLGTPETTGDRGKLFEGAEVKFDKASRADDGPTLSTSSAQSGASEGSRMEGAQIEENEAKEVQNIDLVATVEDFQEDKEANDEKRMIEGIFARSVDSAYEHDQIVNGKPKVRADPAMLRYEANRIAASAAAHLRRAGEEARSVPIGTVTWTGEVGTGGRPGSGRRGRAGPGSGAILAGLATRQGLATSAGSSRSATPDARGSNNNNLKAKDFMVMIQTFMRRHDGKVPSKMLVDHFNPYCPNAGQTEEFKAALDRVATLSKMGSSGRGVWTLKPGY